MASPAVVAEEPRRHAYQRLFGSNPLLCPACNKGVLVVTRVLPPSRP